jgi:hypothetical protein
VVKTFAENDDVMFGDVVLSGGGPRGGPTSSPGAGGWPTIRYYNKETGADGHNYDKKTDMSMCDELGPKGEHYMQDYVLEAGGTSLCSIEAPYKGCKKKEITFIEKLAEKDADFIVAQLERLTKMKDAGSKMKEEQEQWMNQRISILQKFAANSANPEHAEL